uniref:Histone deacetylase n=1 Tax=Astyanax mexicanus TaxID=7994 RepID=A0A3B1JEU0_ASTMX
MDLRVGERVMRPAGSDTALLSPLQRPLLLNPFTPQHCAQYSQHLRFNMEQHLQDQEDKKQQLQLIMHKDKSQQSAVASSVVKQKLAEVILKKRKEKSSTNPLSSTPVAYRELAPDPSVSLQPHLSSPPQPHPDGPDDPPLRRASTKKSTEHQEEPLTRKESAPPTIKHRAPDTLDSSPSSSSTPVSGCSSPNDSLPNENGVLPPAGALSHEAQRILLPDGSLAHFSVPVHSSLPTITLGLPAHAKVEGEVGGLKLGRVPLVSGGSPVLVPLGVEEQSAPLLQPLFILEPSGLVHAPLLAVPGLSPLQFSAAPGPHKPLSRTRSEPLPPSPRTLHTHLLHQQHHGNQILHRLKQHTHTWLMTKSSEKPRLRQTFLRGIWNSERGVNPGAESMREAESQDDQLNLQQTLILNQSRLWETQKQLQQLRRQTAHMETLAVPMMLSGVHRPLSRTQSSPASTSLTLPEKTLPITSSTPETHSQPRFTTGLVYDSQMLKHQCTCGDNSTHPEHAGRIQSIWSRLQERGLRVQCESIRGRKATLEELSSVYIKSVICVTLPPTGILSQRMFVMLPCGGVGVIDHDTIWNEMHTSTASRMAAGSVTELAFRVAKGELKNGFAVVRPPGHHADPSNPMGFCFFNSVAIAAKQLQQKLSVTKILIVDWDVHHGNGTQEIFYNDPSVLYISLHRYDNGNFFPGSGGPTEVGSGAGEGFNVNVAWTGGLEPPMGDAEYLAAFRTVVMPIAREFSPDVVLVSSGFDAAEGHPAPLGGYKVTAKCFGFLTRQLMVLAGGRVVLALEGGHDLTAICDASEACVSALLGVEDPFPEEVLLQKPNDNAVLSLQRVLQIQSQYWSSVKAMVGSVGSAFLGAPAGDCEETAVKALASLSVGVLTNKSLPDEPMEHDQ